MTSSKGLFKSIASLGVVQIANYVLPLISIPIISRIIGPEKLGVINYAVAFIAYFNILIGFGFDLTATRRLSKEPKNIRLRITIFNEVLWSQFLLLVVSLVAYVICIYFLPPLAKDKEVAAYTFLICIGTFFSQNWLFQAMHDLPKIAWINFLFKVLFTIMIIMNIKEEDDYVLHPLFTGMMHISISLFCFIWAFYRYELKFIAVKIKDVFRILHQEKVVFFSLLAINLYTTTNTVMLGLLETPTQVGFYTASQRLMSVVIGVINMPLSQAFYPFIGLAFVKSIEHGIETIQKILPVVIIFTLLTAIIIFFMGPSVVVWFYGAKFTSAIPVIKILAIVPMIVALSNMFGMQIMLNLKLDRLYFMISAGGSVFGLALNYVMITNFGFIGTAWNWLLVESYIAVVMYIALRIRGIDPIDFRRFSVPSMLELLGTLRRK
ncbi:polysaccharide biosynthesis protein [Pedobacter quisquiliarum]|uniref:Polysaccharide biosynthesis protein n=1 Tax=Pedobacter quisquiliarum TaxID=1834438 RepID=A0A916XEP2_9SPHI|nr:oligosaccharide flippase family protein [Pedobacter quisquiliarum]GGC64921.1 polysaccharide biosynthesis protein [Pedobacter quisquiliarum]